MRNNATDITISSHTTAVDQDQGIDAHTGMRYRRVVEIVTDGAQLLEISNRIWDQMSHDDQLKYNAWVEDYHYLLVEIAIERIEIRERIAEIIAGACDPDDVAMIAAAIKIAKTEVADQVAA